MGQLTGAPAPGNITTRFGRREAPVDNLGLGSPVLAQHHSPLNAAVLQIHHLVMTSLGFWCALVLLGVPLGVTPALSALIGVTRQRGQGGLSSYSTLATSWTRSVGVWRAALPGLLPLAVLLGAILVALALVPPFGFALALVAGAWCLMVLNHMALRLSFGQSAWGAGRPGWREFFALSWWHLLSVLAWAALALLSGWSPFLAVLFGPALVAAGLQVLGAASVRAVFAPA